ncbi:MAG: hypothetical protein ACRD9Q_09205 [Nitrososphaeraceae archaeon]
MANRYYRHHTVKSAQDASVFSDEYTWAILDTLRTAGPSGMSAQNVHKQMEAEMGRVSKSKVYGILKRMYQNEWIHRTYNEVDEARRNSIKMDWAGIMLEDEYDRVVVEKEKRFINERLFPVFLEYIKKTIEDISKDKTSKKWIPEKDYCKPCRKSHEASEFFSSLLDIATAEFMTSEAYLSLLKHLGFAELKED